MLNRHPHIVAAAMIIATAALLLLLWAWAMSGGSNGPEPDAESRFRAYLHTPAGAFVCSYMAVGGVLTPEADDELSPEQIYAIIEEECGP